jgi:hypothetical protein
LLFLAVILQSVLQLFDELQKHALLRSTLLSLQKAKKSYQKDLESSQRNVDGDTSAAPGDGCVRLTFIYISAPYCIIWYPKAMDSLRSVM